MMHEGVKGEKADKNVPRKNTIGNVVRAAVLAAGLVSAGAGDVASAQDTAATAKNLKNMRGAIDELTGVVANENLPADVVRISNELIQTRIPNGVIFVGRILQEFKQELQLSDADLNEISKLGGPDLLRDAVFVRFKNDPSNIYASRTLGRFRGGAPYGTSPNPRDRDPQVQEIIVDVVTIRKRLDMPDRK